MKRVTLKELKNGLSAAVAVAEAGDTVIITRHNTPVAQLGPAHLPHLHRGDRVGKRIEPALKRGTKGRYLAVLREDRGNR